MDERFFAEKWWAPGKGPIFFYTGNEGPITEFWEATGFIFEIAPQFGALVVFAEHVSTVVIFWPSECPNKINP